MTESMGSTARAYPTTAPVLPFRAGPGLTHVERVDVPEQVDWVIPGIVARGAVTIIAGEAGSGKSMWCLQQAAAVMQAGLRSVYIDAQNTGPLIQQRLVRFLPAPVVYEAHPGVIDLTDNSDQLNSVAAGADLLVLDSWESLWSGSDMAKRASQKCLEGMRVLAKRHGCGILLIHHTTKGADTYQGNPTICQTVEALFMFTRVDGNPNGRCLSTMKMRIAAEPAPAYMELRDGVFYATPAPTAPVGTSARGVSSLSRAVSPKELLGLIDRGVFTPRQAAKMAGQPWPWWKVR